MAQRIDKVEIKNLQELTPGEGVQIDSETKYDTVGQFEAQSAPLIDPGEGKQIALRVFAFKINPDNKDFQLATKQAIFNSHAHQISHVLWGDGLRPLEEIAPRVIINLKKGFYKIFVACEAAKGLIWSHKDKPMNLTQELAKRKPDTPKI